MTRADRIAAWKAEYARRENAAERIRTMQRARADAECKLAGVGSWHGCVCHNAMIGLRVGRPWPEVNYAHLRRALWIMEQQQRATRLVDAWASQTMRKAFASE